MICEPSISASNVTIYEDGVGELSLCEVMVTATGKKCKRFFASLALIIIKIIL